MIEGLALAAPEAVLLAPGDSPGLSAALVEHLIRESRVRPDRILVPVVARRRGHPLLLPWDKAKGVRSLPPDLGVNALLAGDSAAVEYIETDDDAILADLDTPDDYSTWESRSP